MFKTTITKIIGIGLFTLLLGGLLAGAVNRTLAKSGNEGWTLAAMSDAAFADHSNSEDYRQGYGGSSRNGQRPESGNPAAEEPCYEAEGTGGYQRGGGHAEAYGEANAVLPPADPTGLSDDEAAGLLFMREEEKLARDIYTTLAARWSLPVFSNIARSERTHMDTIAVLLDRYGLNDPAQNEAGVFSDAGLQALYNELVERGSQSSAEALQVAAAIEEMDIVDLRTRLAQSDNADIVQAYNNLLAGSSNHLRAFVRTLFNQTGVNYQPQYLSAEDYQAILSATDAPGQGSGKGFGKRQP